LIVASKARRFHCHISQDGDISLKANTNEISKGAAPMAGKKDIAITADSFREWQEGLGTPNHLVAKQLGISTNSPTNYRQNGAGRTVALACSAIEVGLDPWSPAGRAEMQALRYVLEAIRSAKEKLK
jgi:hypothetical protein